MKHGGKKGTFPGFSSKFFSCLKNSAKNEKRKTLQLLNVLFQKKKAKLVGKILIYLLFTSMIQNKFILSIVFQKPNVNV